MNELLIFLTPWLYKLVIKDIIWARDRKHAWEILGVCAGVFYDEARKWLLQSGSFFDYYFYWKVFC